MPEANASAEGWIYFVEAEGLDAVKIGFARNLACRMKSLQCGSPVRLLLAYAVKTSRQEEVRLHRLCAHARLHNEWFQTSECFELLAAACARFEKQGLRVVESVPAEDIAEKKERDAKYAAHWKPQTRERERARMREYRALDPDRHRARVREWASKNKEKRAAYRRAQRAAKKAQQ